MSERSGLPLTLAGGSTVEQGDAVERLGTLVVIAGTPADVGLHASVDPEVVIGREGVEAGGGKCLVLHDGRISRRHVRIFKDGTEFFAEDLGSTNGTVIEGDELERTRALCDGDRLTVGNTILKFSVVDDMEAAYLARMSELAGTDPLTGLLASHRFDSLVEAAVAGLRLADEPVSLLMLDLDGLKAINDRHGHRFGAHVIAGVGRSLGTFFAGVGQVSRIGGDEYAVLVRNLGRPGVQALAERACGAVAGLTLALEGVALPITASLGLAVADPGQETTAAALSAAADAALYRAKAAGRNRVSE